MRRVQHLWLHPASPDLALQGVLAGHQHRLARDHEVLLEGTRRLADAQARFGLAGNGRLPEHTILPRKERCGGLLRKLHQMAPPPVPLPGYRPLVSVRQAIESSHVIDEDERAWLRNRCDELLAAYDRLGFPLPAGMIHGDAWRGNLLRDGPRIVLADWDEVSTGPREVDLVPTLQGTRFGLPEPQRDTFIAAYGHDIRGWDGYPILREIRELSTTTALLRDGNANEVARQELKVRLRSIRNGNDYRWTTF